MPDRSMSASAGVRFPACLPQLDHRGRRAYRCRGLYDHNKKLSENRARTVARAIEQYAKGRYQSLTARGVGEDDPLYTNDLPEGRFYNRTVQVLISTPIEAGGVAP